MDFCESRDFSKSKKNPRSHQLNPSFTTHDFTMATTGHGWLVGTPPFRCHIHFLGPRCARPEISRGVLAILESCHGRKLTYHNLETYQAEEVRFKIGCPRHPTPIPDLFRLFRLSRGRHGHVLVLFLLGGYSATVACAPGRRHRRCSDICK